MMDFEQLAFIEKWRQKASRGVVVVLDGTRGDILVTLRVGDLGPRTDMRGQDATGAVRKQRLSIGDRVFMAIEYRAKDARVGTGEQSVSGGLVGANATVSGTVSEAGEVAVVDCGVPVLVRGETRGPGIKVGDAVEFTVDGEGKAYLIPTRG